MLYNLQYFWAKNKAQKRRLLWTKQLNSTFLQDKDAGWLLRESNCYLSEIFFW